MIHRFRPHRLLSGGVQVPAQQSQGADAMTVRTVCLSLALSVPLSVFAEGMNLAPEEINAIRTYCKADVERLCPNVEPGEGRIKACLMTHKEEMSVGCAQAMQKLKKSK
jgi:hypothetical protein